MVTQTKTAAHVMAYVDPANVSGHGKTARLTAFASIAPHAYAEGLSRNALIADIRVALGTTPKAEHILFAKREFMVGRMASRMPAGEFPGVTRNPGDRLEFCRDLLLNYAAPPTEKKGKAKKLRAGQQGRRTSVQEKVKRAAEEAWSQVAAELAIGKAQTQKERNAAKKSAAPTMVGTGKGKASKDAVPAHSVLVQPEKPLTADAAHAHLVQQMVGLVAYCNKYAKLIETGYSMPIMTCHKAILKADGERRVRQDAENAIKDDKSK